MIAKRLQFARIMAMGHTRLGKIPTTKRWREVVATFAVAGSDSTAFDSKYIKLSKEVPKIAASTMEAAASALRASVKDGGLAFVFYLLTQLALCARRSELTAALKDLGITLPSSPSNLDLTTEIHRVIDEHFRETGRKSDASEMAQLAAGETLAAYFRNRPRDLFAPSTEQLALDLRQLGTQRTFGEFSRTFFSNFMSRMLGFYLSKFVVPGEHQHLIGGAADLTLFNSQLNRLCRFSANRQA
jgi:hypothetical protein